MKWKDRITRNVHEKYESPTSNGSKAMTNIKGFRYVGQRSRSSSRGQEFGMNRKATSQAMYIRNMKTLPLMVQKLWQMLKFTDI